MKALILVLILVVAAYVGWVNIPAGVRTQTIKKVRPHAIRLGILIITVIVLAYAVYLLPSFRLT